MANRGPKAQTAAKSRRKSVGNINWDKVRKPDGMSDGAVAEWRRLVNLLDDLGTLTRMDPAIVEACATAIDLLRRARETVDLEGLTVPIGEEGRLIAHPMLNVVNQQMSQSRRLLSELGLTLETNKHAGSKSDSDHGAKWAGLLKVHGG